MMIEQFDEQESEEESEDEDDERRFNDGKMERQISLDVLETKHLNPLLLARFAWLLSRLPTAISKLRKGDVAAVTNFAITHAGQGGEEIVRILCLNVEQPFVFSECAKEDEDEEPTLKYDLLGGATSQLLEKDSASSLAVSSKYIVCVMFDFVIKSLTPFLLNIKAMGTHSGIIHVLDYSGERVKSYRPHSASINDMCFDSASEFIATASVDGM